LQAIARQERAAARGRIGRRRGEYLHQEYRPLELALWTFRMPFPH
jgi:hypothetical protein